MQNPSSLLKEAQSHLQQDELALLSEAYAFAKETYGTQRCATEETCLEQVEKVAHMLLTLHPDVHTIIATLLQYCRTREYLEEIKKRFGKTVSDIISSLSILEGAGTLTLRSPAQLRRFALELSKDIRVLLIYLHNRWYLLSHAEALEQNGREAIARETLTVFAPICARLGIYSLKYALETLSFSLLYPEDATDIAAKLKQIRKRQGSFLQKGQHALEKLLQEEGIHALIIAREKHPYSVFRKMQMKGIANAENLYDLFGMRILVESIEDCYRVLGIIHRTYRPITHRIKDYIAMPKPNGYRSLHTTIMGLSPKDAALPVEIQIRTFAMDQEAEFGIAAHWDYKEKATEEPKIRMAWQERMRALQQLSEKQIADDDDLGEEVSDRIFVLTPRGDPVELPKRAKTLDFAFRIHTDVGLCFRSAKVNGSIASIDQPLENGDMVEIQTWNEPRPSREWEKIVSTKDARSKIRSYFKSHESELEKREKPKAVQQHLMRKEVPRAAHYTVQLDAETNLPFRYARCCEPQKHKIQRPPIIGLITRAGIVTVHWAGCQMLEGANPERFVRAEWLAAEEEKKPAILKTLRKKIFARNKR